jgi:lipopolysaccharide transport system ATP-binding protein
MSGVALRVDGVSKKYRIGVRRIKADLRDALADSVTRSVRALTRRRRYATSNDTFWALRDVSFDVAPG